MSKLVQQGTKIQQKVYEKSSAVAEEALYQIKTVSSFGNYQYEIERFSEGLEQSLKAGLIRSFRTGLSVGIHCLLSLSSFTVAYAYGSNLILSGEKRSYSDEALTGADVFMIVVLIVDSTIFLMDSVPNIKAVAQACISVAGYFEAKENITAISKKIRNDKLKPSIDGRIKFNNVTFGYLKDGGKKILTNFNLEFEYGKTTAIIGESGCGKSTIVNLIERLYPIQEGEIMIDDYPIETVDLCYYRSLIGYVSQEPVLFSDTIRNNIVLGRSQVSEQDIADVKYSFNINLL
jgi:ABC-type multidrug transport system fused ATPase/permease subunit